MSTYIGFNLNSNRQIEHFQTIENRYGINSDGGKFLFGQAELALKGSYIPKEEVYLIPYQGAVQPGNIERFIKDMTHNGGLSCATHFPLRDIAFVYENTSPYGIHNVDSIQRMLQKAKDNPLLKKQLNAYRAFHQEKEKDIYITSKARQLLKLVPEDLKKPELTASWELKLGKIARGELKQEAFLSSIRGYTEELISEIKTADGTFRHENITGKKCPRCGKYLLAVNGKNSKMLVCQDRECGYRETISRTTNARCPKCHKRMEMYVKGKEETFVCQCGYKEKLSAFQARRQKEGAGVGKRDVQNYLRRQQKEANEPVNNAFAQALSGIKL